MGIDQTARSLFHRGSHWALVETFWDCDQPSLEPEVLPFLIGSLSFLGRSSEAEILFAQHRETMSPEAFACSLFFIAIGYARTSDLLKASPYLMQLARRRKDKAALSFWFFQGAAFQRYMQNRFGNALKLAEKAYERATSSQDFYARALASDLLGHAQIAVGEIFSGIKNLEQAYAFFEKIGNKSHCESIRRSLVTYRARHSVHAGESLAGFDNLLAELQREENNFSLAGTWLEITGILGLTGQMIKAEDALNKAAEIIHRDGLELYADRLDLRRAYLLLLRGQPQKALRTLQRVQPRKHELVTRMQLDGLRSRAESADRIDNQERQQILRRSQHRISQRIEGRGQVPSGQHWGKDPLGDLLDELSQPESNIEDRMESIERHGFWGLAYEALALPRDIPALVFNALPGLILIMDRGEVSAHRLQPSSQLHRCFELLAREETSKETLVRELWGYEYHPLRHDQLIYGLISRVRTVLGNAEHWLIARENTGYRLIEGLELIYIEAAKRSPHPPAPIELPTETINQRQRKILRYLDQNESIDVQVCGTLFEGVSKTTLTRDLSQLVELQYLKKVGKARNTCYLREKL